MAQTKPKTDTNTLTLLDWVGYIRYMRHDLEDLSPDAAAHLMAAEATLLREANRSGSIFLPGRQPRADH